MVNIRYAKLQDAQTFYDYGWNESDVFARYALDRTSRDTWMTVFLQLLEDTNCEVFVVSVDQKIVAFCTLYYYDRQRFEMRLVFDRANLKPADVEDTIQWVVLFIERFSSQAFIGALVLSSDKHMMTHFEKQGFIKSDSCDFLEDVTNETLMIKKQSQPRTWIIAEAGVNHNGSIDRAYRMIEEAKNCGVDTVKFQTFKTEEVISELAPKADYQMNATGQSETQLEMCKKLELSIQEQLDLFEFARSQGIEPLSTPFDLGSVHFLSDYGLNVIKIPSGEITHLPYLEAVGACRKRILLSTGMATLAEIKTALDVLIAAGTPKYRIMVLQCNTEYPTPFCDVNLKAMLTIKNELGVAVGYSDHTPGVEAAIAAVALGAKVIEKHFTLDKNLPGPDHQASLDVPELATLVRSLRKVEQCLGDGIKKPSPSEMKNIAIARKSIVAAYDIAQGECFTDQNVKCKRPGDGLSPMRLQEVIGQPAKRDFKKDELIEV